LVTIWQALIPAGTEGKAKTGIVGDLLSKINTAILLRLGGQRASIWLRGGRTFRKEKLALG